VSFGRSRRFGSNVESGDRNAADNVSGPDCGFTLVELLVVLVILPLIIGAIAAALIVSEDNTTTTRESLEASTSAQDISLYFVRDVQAAEYVTTANVSGPSGPQSPQVCPTRTPQGAQLVLALYRPANAADQPSNALSVAYWITGGPTPELVRDECTVNPDFTVTLSSEEVLSDNIASDPVIATIAPSSISSAAGAGWAPTSTAAATVSSISLSLTQPGSGSGYSYGFAATPREWSSQNAGVPTEAGAP
jgi:prepilin-type N-terminal cleavage/methylation domain-containing protein